MGRVFSVANQKGGVGKTTTVINLAAALALADQRILVVDMDPQGNLTSGVGLKGHAGPGGTVYQALTTDQPLEDPSQFILETPVGISGSPRRTAISPARKSSSSPSPTGNAGCATFSGRFANGSISSSSIPRRRWGC